jgi:hypothetical protein
MNPRSTAQQAGTIIPRTRSGAARWPTSDRNPVGFGSEQVAGFKLECMAGFAGIRQGLRKKSRQHEKMA